MRPESTGWVRLASPDPRQAPLLQPNYLSTGGSAAVAWLLTAGL